MRRTDPVGRQPGDPRRGRPLRAGRIDLWIARTDHPGAAGVARRIRELLPTDEQAEARRFRRAQDQQQFVIARAMVRWSLSRHFPLRAADWRFDRDDYGKPFVAFPHVLPSVQFSISHTDGMIACVVTRSAEAGVDAEKVEHNQDLPLVAGRVFSPAELVGLGELSGAAWTRRFFELWTLKEAYAKARGLGLSLTWSDIDFEPGPNNTARVRFASAFGDDPALWAFWRRSMRSGHVVAVAAKRNFSGPLEVVPRRIGLDEIVLSMVHEPDMPARRKHIRCDGSTGAA